MHRLLGIDLLVKGSDLDLVEAMKGRDLCYVSILYEWYLHNYQYEKQQTFKAIGLKFQALSNIRCRCKRPKPAQNLWL